MVASAPGRAQRAPPPHLPTSIPEGRVADRLAGAEADARRTESGIPVERVYDASSVAGLDLEERLGEPGAYPFTRGVHATMYRERPWTMRQYAGFATAEETNERFRYLLAAGAPGLSMAFDLPTQLGMDSDDPRAAGRGGPGGRGHRLGRGHGAPVPGHPARPRVDQHDDQRAGRRAAAALPAGGRGAGRRPGRAARDDPERRAQGVRGPRQLHLPARARRCA